MRTPRKLRSRPEAYADGSDGQHPGSRGSAPAMALKRNAVSATVRAIGPLTENPRRGKGLGDDGTSPTVGRNPTTLLKLPGFLSEPPRSLPSAMGNIPVASATPAPPLEPPALFVTS